MYLGKDFLLDTPSARALYFEHAADQPILDYHNHLPPAAIASDHRFRSLTEIWLGGDHYKWRALRSNGVSEDFITGPASDWEKFEIWARTVPHTLGNPLHHWTHLELQRVFDIHELLDESSARRIYDAANEKLASPEFSARSLLARFRVRALCTTDDPAHPLEQHEALAAAPDSRFRMYPTFRPDGAFAVDAPARFSAWCGHLAKTSRQTIGDLAGLLGAIDKRHADFHALGGRLSDHGLECIPATTAQPEQASGIVRRCLQGIPATPDETAAFGGFLLRHLGRLDAKAGWTKQLHLGALRNNNSRLLRRLGADAGVDSIGDFPQARSLAAYLDDLDRESLLPRTVLYNLNPADNYVFATMIGNFQDGTIPGKIQFGSGWWFLDQLEGMEWQIHALAQLGLLSRFIGMLTDSRSFLSFPRHEYFRRLLCRILGRQMEGGLLPKDAQRIGAMVRSICFSNARDYLRLELPPAS